MAVLFTIQNRCTNIHVKMLLPRKPQRTEYDLAYTLRDTNILNMSDSFKKQRKLVRLLRRRPGSLNINDNLQQILMRNTVSSELSMVTNCKPTLFDNNQLYSLFPVHVTILPSSNPNATLLQVLLNEYNIWPPLYTAIFR